MRSIDSKFAEMLNSDKLYRELEKLEIRAKSANQAEIADKLKAYKLRRAVKLRYM